jgi:hypothetical protein
MQSEHRSALGDYLKELDLVLFGKAMELHSAVAGWLSYIPHTFPHYTRHTIAHSESIATQLSFLLFYDADPRRPYVELNSIEAYILLAAADLHDAGMVASDAEKTRIVESAEWKEWTTSGGGTERWRAIQRLREQCRVGGDPPGLMFSVDLQIRFLVAEFVRRTHALRSGIVLQQYEPHLGRFAFGDPLLRKVIEDVCVSHGMTTSDLYDTTRFPLRTNIGGKPVNVRLLAILLRLGDLLDMEQDRACPLLLNAACPIPEESYAHWTQYQRIRHIAITPRRIELTAHCLAQREHRVLHDWCTWIVQECSAAHALLAQSDLHRAWRPPVATIDRANATIVIQPAVGATYIPSNWRFTLDQDEIFNRLIRDVYDHKYAYIRELVQNAADATRCKMLRDLELRGVNPPLNPARADAAVLDAYPISISLSEELTKNELSGELEPRQVLTIDDFGMGMDIDIITRFLLQIGRSFYQSADFRRSYKFSPSSRFGLGFLAVFAVSDNVVVETYRPDSTFKDGPLRLELVGPRTEVLAEHGDRGISGTRIRVRLRDTMPRGDLLRVLTHWCRRIEFPIYVNDRSELAVIRREVTADFSFTVPDEAHEGAEYELRAFELQTNDIDGAIYLYAWRSRAGVETWLPPDPASHEGNDRALRFFKDMISLQGMRLESPRDHPEWESYSIKYLHWRRRPAMFYRCDYRGTAKLTSASRNSARGLHATVGVAIDARLGEALDEHIKRCPLADGSDGWLYRQGLAALLTGPRDFWNSLPGTIPLLYSGRVSAASADAVRHLPELQTVFIYDPDYWSNWKDRIYHGYDGWDDVIYDERRDEALVDRRRLELDGLAGLAGPILLHADIEKLTEGTRRHALSGLTVTNLEALSSRTALVTWHRQPSNGYAGYGETQLLDLGNKTQVGMALHDMGGAFITLLNSRSPLVRWVLTRSKVEALGELTASPEASELIELLQQAILYARERHDAKLYALQLARNENADPTLIAYIKRISSSAFNWQPARSPMGRIGIGASSAGRVRRQRC